MATHHSNNAPSSVEVSPLLLALMDKRVTAEVVDLDHYRIRGGMAVETDFIIRVEPTSAPTSDHDPQIESFTLSKSYSAFRTLGHQLKKASDEVTSTEEPLPKSVHKLAQYCETIVHLVETQRTQYLGKVNYNYVKALAKKRSLIINECLEATLNHFPDELRSHPFHGEIAQAIETFFLLDHCLETEHERGSNKKSQQQDLASKPKGSEGTAATTTTSSSTVAEKHIVPSTTSCGDNPLEAVGHNVGIVLKEIKSKLYLDDKHQNETNKRAYLKIDTTAPSTKSLVSPVVPYTRKSRRSLETRHLDDDELNAVGEDANLLLDDDRPPTEFVPSYSRPLPSFRSRGHKLGDLLENNPIVFALITVAAVLFLRFAANLTVAIDLDIMLLLIWACFCVGLHTPRPMVGGIDKSTGPPPTPGVKNRRALLRRSDHAGRTLLRMSMISTPDAQASTRSTSSVMTFDQILEEGTEHDDVMEAGQSPLPQFPEGAEIGSMLNCWSEPVYDTFKVRGPKYLKDKVKVPSGEFVFPVRAVDLFLTDLCPENAGSNPGVLGGNLRDKPTFIVNFRLPWGILLAYFEIPERFLPFVRAGHEDGFDASTLPPLDSLSNEDRCVARFLQGSQAHKNSTLKIVPMVVEGPWVVKSVVTGKPAIIGNKMPVNYFYQKAENNGKQMYLEADLDIVASSAARGILSLARTYTQVLTIDLGFVVQGNSQDELPEQMLVGCRLHGIDPLSAPPLPPSKDMFMRRTTGAEDDEEGDS